MSECSSERSFGALEAASSAGTAVFSPIRPSAWAAARRLCIDEPSSILTSSGTAARSRQRPAEWIAAWRTVSSGSASRERAISRAAGSSTRVSTPDSVAPQRDRRIGCERLPQRRKSGVLASRIGERFDCEALHGRTRVAEQLDEFRRGRGRREAFQLLANSAAPRRSVTGAAPAA